MISLNQFILKVPIVYKMHVCRVGKILDQLTARELTGWNKNIIVHSSILNLAFIEIFC